MPQTDPRIDQYISAAAPFAQPILRHLRTLVHKACPDVVETMKWSSPSFTYGRGILCSMAAFKAHMAFGFWHPKMRERLERELGQAENAMGHFGRITNKADLPTDKVLLGYLKEAVRLNESNEPLGMRPEPQARAEEKIPEDLAAALSRNKKAAKNFQEFTPGRRREYIQWITEAKRPETRASRLKTTIEWVTEGKQRHWKYQDC